MSDSLGRIAVPTVLNSGQTFPFTTQHPFGFFVERPVIVHRFGSLDAKQEQRYFVGVGPRKFQFQRPNLNWQDQRTLRSFWESMQGQWQAFNYRVPNADGTTSTVLVTFEQAPISFEFLRTACQVGLNFIEVISPTTAPFYPVSSTCLRFPSSALSAALLSETQQIIPLVHIRVRESVVPDIYVSDRRVTVGGQLYLPRLIGIGEPGSNVLITQDIKGANDNVRFTFGNADRCMTQLANDTDLKYASIDLCLYHVNSGILLQLWKGVIQSFVSDGSPNFPVQCSDGFFQVMNQYPERQASRQCWKDYNDGVNCPFATKGALNLGQFPQASAASCDYYLESPNGCQAHGMSPYFGGQQADPQGVVIKDDSTGFIGFGRNTVTATSIISETIWGLALPEIWCNSGGDPLYAFMANALMVAYRDESGYADSLGILGAGPLGGFTPSMVVTNADGYRYVVAPTVDGYLWQGLKVDGNLNISKYQPGYGLRQVLGNDPANATTDYFSLGAGGGTNLLGVPVPQTWEPNNYAAGVALCEIRIVKSTTIQPSTPDQHQMQVPIDYGLWGWTWDQNGNRTAVKGLINPFWIAVNMMLRAMGLYGDPSTGSTPGGGAGTISAAQLSTFVLSSLVAGDGSGAAEIAAAQVPAILGTGDETQFQFQGMISTQKPFRDWLAEVLNCCLGYYTWEFGALKLGCRINASAVDAYTVGNTLFQSLRLQPITAAFEHLVTSYADVAYQYQANTAEYCDKSHAAYYGRPGAPLTAQIHSVGLARLSQALRVAATRTREEIGGVCATEWRDARRATWQTTLLGLGNEVGQVASQTHPDIPGIHGTCDVNGATVTRAGGDDWNDSLYTLNDGSWASNMLDREAMINGVQVTITAVAIANGGAGSTTASVTSMTIAPAAGAMPANGSGVPFQIITASFRIERWTLRSDWSVEIEGQTVTQSMYDLDVGPKPVDVTPGPLPAKFYPIPFGPAWAPYQVQAAANDALFPGEWTFDADQLYTPLIAGGWLANLVITGNLPVNQFSPSGAGAPAIVSISQSNTGGHLPENSTFWVALCALDADGIPSVPSKIAVVGTGSTATGQFTLQDITWPAVAGLTKYVLFVGSQDDLICMQANAALTPTGGGTTYTPTSITFGGPVARSTWAMPSPYVSRVRIKAKLLLHSGVAGVAVISVATNQVVCSALVDTTTTPFDPTGRVLSVVGRQAGSTPFASFKITAFDHTTGAITLDRDPTGIIDVGDAVVVRNFGTNLTSTPTYVTSVTDTGYVNAANQFTGMTAGAEVGNLIRIIAGTGRGQPPSTITANTNDSLTFQPPLLMDTTSVWIVEAPNWAFQADSTSSGNSTPVTPTQISVPTANFNLQAMLIAGFTVDVNGTESPDGDQPIREDWIYGQPNIITNLQVTTGTGGVNSWTITPQPQTVEVDATNGPATVTLSPFSQWVGDDITIVKTDFSANAVTWQTASSGDTVTGIGTTGSMTSQGASITITATQG